VPGCAPLTKILHLGFLNIPSRHQVALLYVNIANIYRQDAANMISLATSSYRPIYFGRLMYWLISKYNMIYAFFHDIIPVVLWLLHDFLHSRSGLGNVTYINTIIKAEMLIALTQCGTIVTYDNADAG